MTYSVEIIPAKWLACETNDDLYVFINYEWKDVFRNNTGS